jgi:hypothetical protein
MLQSLAEGLAIVAPVLHVHGMADDLRARHGDNGLPITIDVSRTHE